MRQGWGPVMAVPSHIEQNACTETSRKPYNIDASYTYEVAHLCSDKALAKCLSEWGVLQSWAHALGPFLCAVRKMHAREISRRPYGSDARYTCEGAHL